MPLIMLLCVTESVLQKVSHFKDIIHTSQARYCLFSFGRAITTDEAFQNISCLFVRHND